MTVYGAIDLHANNGVAVVLDEQDRILLQRRLPNWTYPHLADGFGFDSQALPGG